MELYHQLAAAHALAHQARAQVTDTVLHEHLGRALVTLQDAVHREQTVRWRLAEDAEVAMLDRIWETS